MAQLEAVWGACGKPGGAVLLKKQIDLIEACRARLTAVSRVSTALLEQATDLYPQRERFSYNGYTKQTAWVAAHFETASLRGSALFLRVEAHDGELDLGPIWQSSGPDASAGPRAAMPPLFMEACFWLDRLCNEELFLRLWVSGGAAAASAAPQALGLVGGRC